VRRILLVEDEAIIALAEKNDLERFGYEVAVAPSGVRAIEACEREAPFDLVLMDIDLGEGMDGAEAAAAILGRREVPVLFISGHSEPGIVEKTERITSYGYVAKGSSPTVIDASIRMALRLFHAKRAALEEKDLLLRETRHRVKNDLAMIGSLLSLQAAKVASEEARIVLAEAGEGIHDMGLLYDKMAEAQGAREVPALLYLNDFAARARTRGKRRGAVRIEVAAEDFGIPATLLRPLGVMLNEMITNAQKYAFEGREEGRIAIAASCRDGLARLTVADDGVGLPASVDFESSTSFGFTLLRTLAAQVEGRVRVGREGGTTFALEFPCR
jgi:two-component sensor histidine kinase